MKTAQTSNTVNENFSSTGKLFTDTYSSMADAYRKQWATSLGIYSHLFTPWLGDGRSQTPAYEIPGMDQFRKNLDMMSDFTRKMMFPFMNKNPWSQWGWWDGHHVADSLFDVYKFQLKQLHDVNHKFAKTLLDSFGTVNTDFEHLYESFLKNSATNFHLAEESLSKIRSAYESASDQSIKNYQKLIEKANEQMETLTRNNMNLWTDIIKSTSHSSKKPKEKTASE